MKYGIYNAYWTKTWESNYEYYIAKVKKLGFDILEISCAALQDAYTTENDLLELKKCAENYGITLTAGYGPSKKENISSEYKNVAEYAVRFFQELIVKLNKLGINILGGGLYSYWPLDITVPMDKRKETERAINNMRIIAKTAEDYNVTLGLEVLNRYEGYILNTCEEAADFVDAVDSSHVKIMLDTFHMNIEEDNIGAAIRMAGNRLGHFHIGEQNRRVPGKGSMPWGEIGQSLREIHYEGGVVMEPFVMSGGVIGKEIKVWRDLVANVTEEILDREAEGALNFVKQVFEK